MTSPYDYRCSHCRTTVRLWFKLPDGHTPRCYDCEVIDLERHRKELAVRCPGGAK